MATSAELLKKLREEAASKPATPSQNPAWTGISQWSRPNTWTYNAPTTRPTTSTATSTAPASSFVPKAALPSTQQPTPRPTPTSNRLRETVQPRPTTPTVAARPISPELQDRGEFETDPGTPPLSDRLRDQVYNMKPGDELPAWIQFQLKKQNTPPPDAGFISRPPNIQTYAEFEAGRQADQAAMQAQAAAPLFAPNPFRTYRESQIAADKEAGTPAWQTKAGQGLQTVFQQDDPVSAMMLPTGTGETKLTIGQQLGPAVGAIGALISPWSDESIWRPAKDAPVNDMFKALAAFAAPDAPVYDMQKFFSPQTRKEEKGMVLPERLGDFDNAGLTLPTMQETGNPWLDVTARFQNDTDRAAFLRLNADIEATQDPELKRLRMLATMRGFQGAANAYEDDRNIQYKYNIGTVRQQADSTLAQANTLATQAYAQRAAGNYAGADALMSQSNQLQQQASALYQNVDAWEKVSYAEIIDSNDDLGLLMAQGVMLDPLNLIDAPVGELFSATGQFLKSLRRPQKLMQAADLTAAVEAGAKMLDDVLPRGTEAGGQFVGKASSWFKRMTDLTVESKAAEDAGNVLNVLFYMLKDIDNVEDLTKVLTALKNAPAQFVRRAADGSFIQNGIDGLRSAALQANGGRLIISPEVLLNPKFVDAAGIVPKTVDNILKSDAVTKAANGAIDKWTLFNEVDKAAYEASRWNRGLVAMEDLPEGTAKYAVNVRKPVTEFATGMVVRTADDVPAVITKIDPDTGLVTASRLDNGVNVDVVQSTLKKLDVAEGTQAKRIAAGDVVQTPDGTYRPVQQVTWENGNKIVTVSDVAGNPIRYTDAQVTVLKPAKEVGERATIQFMDKTGKVIGNSSEMSPQDAKIYKKQLDLAIKGGASNPVTRMYDKALGIERSFLSDMYLNLRPGHWIRNAMAATAAMMADNVYSLSRSADVIDMLSTKGVMSPRILEAATGVTPSNITHAYESLGGAGRVAARASEAANKIWTGNLAFMGGRVPFGEQAFYLKAFGKAFERSFKEAWTDTATRALTEWGTAVGLDPKLTQDLVNTAIEAGIRGGATDVRQALTSVIMGRVQPFILRNIGVPDELLSLNGQKQLTGLIHDWLVNSPRPDPKDPMLHQAINNLFAAEESKYAALLRTAPPQPGNYIWTAQELKNDQAHLLDSYIAVANEAGIDKAAANEQAQALVIPIIQAEQRSWDEFVQRLAGVEQTPAMNVAFDLYARIDQIKQATRAAVDNLMKPVRAAKTQAERDVAWQVKFAETDALYKQMAADIQTVFDDAAMDVRRIETGQEVARKYDWSDVINKYLDYDEQKVLEDRAIELGGSFDTDVQTWEQVIAAQRAYVDQSFYEVYESFRRFPTMETFDMLRSTQNAIDEIGAKGASYLTSLREKALSKNTSQSWKAYFRIRNAVWRQVSDEQVIYNKAATQAIVSNGLTNEGAYNLRWRTTNPFDGDYLPDGTPAEYVLLGMADDGLMAAYRTDTGEQVFFSLPGQRRALPLLPPDVRDVARDRLTMAASLRQRTPVDLTDATWTDMRGRTWTVAAYDPKRNIFRAVDQDGRTKLFAVERGTGAPEMPQSVYDSWQGLIGENFDARLQREMDDLSSRARAQNAPQRPTQAAGTTQAAPQVSTPQTAPQAAPSAPSTVAPEAAGYRPAFTPEQAAERGLPVNGAPVRSVEPGITTGGAGPEQGDLRGLPPRSPGQVAPEAPAPLPPDVPIEPAQVDEVLPEAPPAAMAEAPTAQVADVAPENVVPAAAAPEMPTGGTDFGPTMPPGELPMSDRTRNGIHAAGSKLYGKDWNEVRHRLVSEITNGRETSTARGSTLTEAEGNALISRINQEAANAVPDGERLSDVVQEFKQQGDDLTVAKQVATEQGQDTAAIDAAIAEHEDSLVADVAKMYDEANPQPEVAPPAQAAATPGTFAEGDTVLYNGQEVTVNAPTISRATGNVTGYEIVTADRQYIDVAPDELQPIARQAEATAQVEAPPTTSAPPVAGEVAAAVEPNIVLDAFLNDANIQARLVDLRPSLEMRPEAYDQMLTEWYNANAKTAFADMPPRDVVRQRSEAQANLQDAIQRFYARTDAAQQQADATRVATNAERDAAYLDERAAAQAQRVETTWTERAPVEPVPWNELERVGLVQHQGDAWGWSSTWINRAVPEGGTKWFAADSQADAIEQASKVYRAEQRFVPSVEDVPFRNAAAAPAPVASRLNVTADELEQKWAKRISDLRYDLETGESMISVTLRDEAGEPIASTTLYRKEDDPYWYVKPYEIKNRGTADTPQELLRALEEAGITKPRQAAVAPQPQAAPAPVAQAVPEVPVAPAFNVSPDDVDLQRAERAYSGVSFTPDVRARQTQQQYVEHMQTVYEAFAKYADTPEKVQRLAEMMEDYRTGYLNKMWEYLDAKGRVVSSMIAGPANFPAARMMKRAETENKRLNEFLEWTRKAQERIDNELNPNSFRNTAIRSDSATALDDLRAKLADLESQQERMKQVNKIMRGKGTDDEKLAQITALGFDEESINRIFNPVMGRPGFQSFQLTNNNAEIKRIQDRIARLEKLGSVRGETSEWTFDGGRVVDNVEEGRVQIFFDERISKEQHDKMRHAGFVYSRKNQAYQRGRLNARRPVYDMTGIDLNKPQVVEQVAEQVDEFVPVTGVPEALTRVEDISETWEPQALPQMAYDKWSALGATDMQLRRIDAALAAGDTGTANAIKADVFSAAQESMGKEQAEAIMLRNEIPDVPVQQTPVVQQFPAPTPRDGVVTVADTSLPQWEQDLLNAPQTANGGRYVHANGKTFWVEPQQDLTGQNQLLVSLAAQKKTKSKQMVNVRYAFGEQPEKLEFTQADIDAAKRAWIKQQSLDTQSAFGVRLRENTAARNANIPDDGEIVAVRSKSAEESASGEAWRIEYRIRGLAPNERADVYDDMLKRRATIPDAISGGGDAYVIESRRVDIKPDGTQLGSEWRMYDYGSDPQDMLRQYAENDSSFRQAIPTSAIHPEYENRAMDGIIERLDAKGYGIRNLPTMGPDLQLLNEMGTRSIPGVRLQDAEEAGRVYYLFKKNDISQDDWTKYVTRLWNENRIRDKEAFSKMYPTIAGAQAAGEDMTVFGGWKLRQNDGVGGKWQIINTDGTPATGDDGRALEFSNFQDAVNRTKKLPPAGQVVETASEVATETPDPIRQAIFDATKGRPIAQVMAGPAKAEQRAELLSMLTGTKVPKSKAGVNNLKDAIIEYAGIDTDNKTYAAIDDEIAAWLKGEAVPENAGKREIVGYTWRTYDGEKFSQYDGGLVPARVSDWDNAEISEPTGREIVHVYWVREPDGEVRPYGKNAIAAAMGWSQAQVEKKAKKFIAEAQHEAEQVAAWAKDFQRRPKFDNPIDANESYLSYHKNPSVMNADMWAKDGQYTAILKGENRLSTAAANDGWTNLGDAYQVAMASLNKPGKTTQAWTDPARKYDFQYEVADLDSLVASNLPDGRINPDYPAELQPRDRTQAASQLQIRNIVGNFAPEELLTETNAIDRGAPIVGARNVVESGNGRTMALRSLDDAQYTAYKQMLVDNAQQFGLDPASIENMQRPVLVRRRLSDVDPTEFAAEANARTTLSMNMAEQSSQWAKAISGGDLQYFDMGGANNMREALSMAQNREFVQRIFAKIPANERAAYVDADGVLTTQGVESIRAALFAKVFGDKTDILRNYIQAPTPDLANVGNGLERAIGALAKLTEANPSLSIADDLAEAASMLIDLRRSSISVEERLSQLGLFSSMTDETKVLLRFLDDNIRSGKAIGDTLNRYAKQAIEFDANQLGMFSTVAPSKADMLQSAMRSRPEQFTDSLFGTQLGITMQPIDWRLMFGKKRLQDVQSKAAEMARYMGMTWGKPKQPEVGNMAVHQVKTLAEARQRVIDSLPAIAAQPKMGMNQAAQRHLLNNIDRVLVPNFDNAVFNASDAARAVADGAMLNYQRRRGFDTMLGTFFPYHYFWTRGTYTWAKRLARKPSLANLLYETQRAINLGYQQEGLPERLDGTILVYRGKNGQLRLRNPIEYVMPAAIYGGNSFYDPEDSNNASEYLYKSMMRWLPGFFPHVDIMANALWDAVYPLPNGEKRTQNYITRRFVPLAGIASDVAMATGGENLPTWAGGDNWDEYRIRRTLSIMQEEGAWANTDAERRITQYAQQISTNLENGAERYNEVPAEYQEQANERYLEGGRRAGLERIPASAGSMLLGNSLYWYPNAEAELKGQNADYMNAGFSEANPAGSAAERREVLDENPNLPVWWSKNAGSEKSPAQSAKDSQMWDELETAVYAPEAQEIAQAIMDNPDPDAAQEAIRAVKDKYRAVQEEIYTRYEYQPAERGVPSGASPVEAAQFRLEQMLTYDVPYPEKPAEGASRAEMGKYYDQVEQWYAGRAATIQDRLDQALFEAESDFPDAERQWLAKMVKGMKVDDLLREYSTLKYAGDAEKEWKRQQDAIAIYEREQRAAGEGIITQLFGEQWLNRYDNYLDLEDADRQLARDQYPQISAINLVLYNQDKYQELIALFGEDAFMAWANRPASGDDAAWETYYQDNRDAWLVSAWLNGRPGQEGETTTKTIDLDNPGGAATTKEFYNFGADYNTAIEKFGADIWQIAAGYNSGWSKKQKSAYFDKYPQLSDFYDWWYANLPDDKSTSSGYRRSYSSYRRSYYSRRSYGRSYGGRSYGGGYGSSGRSYGSTPKTYPANIYARESDRNLEVNYAARPWEAPRNTWGSYWPQAGENTRRTVEFWRPRFTNANKARW